MEIYLISSELNNEILYKIGISKNVKKRIKQLKTGNPAILTIVNVFETKWATKIEANLHTRYSTKRITGSKEWFLLDSEDIENFISRCQQIHDNLELLSLNNTWIIDRSILKKN